MQTHLCIMVGYPKHNLGLVCGKLSKVLAIDRDIYKPEYSEDEASKYIPDSIVTPTSETPRKGQHQLFVDPDNELITIGTNVFPGGDWRCNGGQIALPPSVNEKDVPYIWLIQPTERIAPAPSALLSALLNNNNMYRGGEDKTSAGSIFVDGQRDENLYHIALSLAKTGNSEDYIKQVLTALMKSWGEHDATWVNAKIQSALQRCKKQDRTLSADVKEFVLSTSGIFLSTEVYQCLHLSTRDDKKNVSIILKRMCDDNELERYGNKNGQFRRPNNEIESLDWQNAETNPLDIVWPFGINNLVNIYPGNVAVIAGYPNAGKTSFLLNFIRLNQNQHDVHLFSSEGGPEELKMRLSKFDCPLSTWKFKAWDRGGDFADVIKPDAINIIDYLEIHDDFYKVGGMIKAISDKLKSGFALIAMQKNGGRDEGLGGARGLEKT